MGDHPREMAGEVRIGRIEARLDELRMRLVLGEDDRLPQPVAARHFLAARHQVLQHLVYRVLIEEDFKLGGIGI